MEGGSSCFLQLSLSCLAVSFGGSAPRPPLPRLDLTCWPRVGPCCQSLLLHVCSTCFFLACVLIELLAASVHPFNLFERHKYPILCLSPGYTILCSLANLLAHPNNPQPASRFNPSVCLVFSYHFTTGAAVKSLRAHGQGCHSKELLVTSLLHRYAAWTVATGCLLARRQTCPHPRRAIQRSLGPQLVQLLGSSSVLQAPGPA